MKGSCIAIDCRMVGKSGIGTFISELLPHFLERTECLLLGTNAQLEPFVRHPNARFCPCDIRPFSAREVLFFPRKILKQINGCAAFFSPYCNIPGGIAVPVFSTIHDVVFLDVPGLSSKMGTLARKFFYQRAVNLSKEIFTVSEFSRGRILANLRCKKPVSVCYNAPPSYIERDFAPEEKDGSLLFVGNIKKHKGLSVLLDGFRIFLEKFKAESPDSRLPVLKIVGNADNFRTKDGSVMKKIGGFPEGAVEFTGFVSNESLVSLYRKANLLVQPSLYEGFGIPPLEALFCGTNAVLSDIPALKEIYARFPVRFFESGNADSLAAAISESYLKPAPKKSEIPQAYSYGQSAEKILARIFGGQPFA